MRYLVVDLANLFHRAKHVVPRQASMWDKLGYSLHVIFASMNKNWRDQQADHIVICLEGRSWRKDFYAPYKANRAVARAALTEEQQEEDKLFWEAFNDLTAFLVTRSNCTVLHHPELEGDDLIAGWVQSHPADDHTIVSSDTDFIQLLSKNVKQYNGITDELHTLEGIFNKKGKLVIDKKTSLPKTVPDPQWLLFEKIMRGDSSDNVFSAYPGVRVKGTSKKVGLQEAYADRNTKGYAWNNLQLQRWVDHNGVEHKVLDDYNRNKTLIDLTAQPDHIRLLIAETITKGAIQKCNSNVGSHFLKFCGKYELVKLSDYAQQYTVYLNAKYPEKVNNVEPN